MTASNQRTILKLNGKKVYKADQYNYRLEDLNPCVACAYGTEHASKEEKYTFLNRFDRLNDEHRLDRLNFLRQKIKENDVLHLDSLISGLIAKENKKNPVFLQFQEENRVKKERLETRCQTILRSRSEKAPILESVLQDFEFDCEAFFYWSTLQWESAAASRFGKKMRVGPGEGFRYQQMASII